MARVGHFEGTWTWRRKKKLGGVRVIVAPGVAKWGGVSLIVDEGRAKAWCLLIHAEASLSA